jgi:hypothetical protein
MKAKFLLPTIAVALLACATSVFADGAGVSKVPDPTARRSTRTYSVQPSSSVVRYTRGSRFYFPRNENFRTDHKYPGLYVR